MAHAHMYVYIVSFTIFNRIINSSESLQLLFIYDATSLHGSII